MLTMAIGALFCLSYYFLVMGFVEIITILIQVWDCVTLKKGKVTFNFTNSGWKLTIGAALFTGAVILTLIRYGIFKL